METPLDEAMRETFSIAPVDLDAPDFANAGRVHDWRNYVPEAVQMAWGWLDRTARIAVYLTAQEGADAEEWD